MLIITRKLNESLIIQPEGLEQVIEIKITDLGNQVRLGIEAPEGCRIWRKELFQTIQANRQAAEEAVLPNVRSLVSRLHPEGNRTGQEEK